MLSSFPYGMIYIVTVSRIYLFYCNALPIDETSSEVEFSGEEFNSPNISKSTLLYFLSTPTLTFLHNFQPNEKRSSRRGLLRSKITLQNSYYDSKKSVYYAVIVCSASIMLFSVILLVLLLVCRLRKKDEGSYSLDESNICFPWYFSQQRCNCFLNQIIRFGW